MTRDTLESEYEKLLIRANCLEHLPRDGPAFDAAILQLVNEGRSSELIEKHLDGWFANRSDSDLTEAIKQQLHNKRPLAFAVQKLFGEVEEAAAEYGWGSRIPVYAGQFPTGLFNAQAVGIGDGALLLINTGLMMFIYQCSKLFVMNVQLNLRDDLGKHRASVRQKMTDSEIIEALADIVLAYRFRGDSTFAARFPVETGVRGMLTGIIAQAAEFFVISHEYGHAIAGHLSCNRSIRRATTEGGIEMDFISKDWEEEIEADIYGAHLIAPPSKRRLETEAQFQLLAFRLAGPFLFFALDELINAVNEIVDGHDVSAGLSDHPPSETRAEAVHMFFESIGADRSLLELSHLPSRWVNQFTDPVCDYINSGLRNGVR